MAINDSLPQAYLRRQISVAVIGAGGTGSVLLPGLAQLHLALLALGHPHGFHVEVYDPDTVSSANIGRQCFYPGDVGQYKANLLVHRLNTTFGTDWSAMPVRIDAADEHDADIVIGCVDNRKARLAITKAFANARYYLDCGNEANTGQVIFGEINSQGPDRLPHVGDLFPELLDPERDGADTAPSCSMEEALRKQSLFINRAVAQQALCMLWTFFREGKIKFSGSFVNLTFGTTQPLKLCPKAWARFGYHSSASDTPVEEVQAVTAVS